MELDIKTLDLLFHLQGIISKDELKVKRCSYCCRLLTVDNFYKNGSQKDGYRINCKKCSK